MSALVDRKVKSYKVQLKFLGGEFSQPFIIQAYDAVSASAKLAGIIGDQPKEIVGFNLEKLQPADAPKIEPIAGGRLPPGFKLNGG